MSRALILRIGRIREEFDVAKAAVDYLERSWSSLHRERDFRNLQSAQVQLTAANLEATYIVRLFSAFEASLRGALPRNLPDRRSAYDLINRAASKWRIPPTLLVEVHQVREFRNYYVHQAEAGSSVALFADTLATLNRFLSWLPEPPLKGK